ncbi:MAG TPA: imelysin family protein [Polyangiales bacterium]|nr:imelysin family protein [Polyangiales bacterium]
MSTVVVRFVGLTCVLLACAACDRGASDDEIQAALATYSDIAEASYADAVLGARQLDDAIHALLTQPSAASLQAAREAWLEARVPYVQSEVFRFYDGPIDAVEMFVNPWPIDETYVEPGILADTEHYPELTRELLLALNVKQGETSIATGYHVIEFLLWGRDVDPNGPGSRPYTDYVRGADPLAERRGRYLELVAELLVTQLQGVARAWQRGPDSYRNVLATTPPREALALVWKGWGTLSGVELAGERLTVPYETKSQENEHSCFSDSTQRDLTGDAQGISNVCTGEYRRSAGTSVRGLGMCELVGRYDRTLGKTLASEIAASLEAVRAIPAPFDRAVLGSDETPSRKRIAHAISALQQHTETLARAASLMQLGAAR